MWVESTGAHTAPQVTHAFQPWSKEAAVAAENEVERRLGGVLQHVHSVQAQHAAQQAQQTQRACSALLTAAAAAARQHR